MTASRPIRRLTPTTVERIAAGEVVERPASVVKELLENALDAGATTISVRLTGGGLERIEVADDGAGIPPDELALAVERHATSKLDPDGPVERIEFLGFRGEALAAIGAVSRLRLSSRTADREVATGVSVVGGSPVGGFEGPRAPGTTVEVEDLFFNTPARRKFLKSPAAEQLEVVRCVERVYLARPSVTYRVESDGREIGVYPATSDLLDAAAAVLGPEFRRHGMRFAVALPGGRLRGVVGDPSVGASSSAELFLAVNGRSVSSRPIGQAVRAAYGDRLPRTRFPVGLLHLEVAGDRLDVNVHPTKREVRFARERDVADAVRRAVAESLGEGPAVAEPPGGLRAPASAGAPARFAAVPGASTGPLQSTLDRETTTPIASSPAPAPRRGEFELLGVLDALYWVAATDDGFVVIDQHAASERVLFAEVLRHGRVARQELVAPVLVDLTPAQRASLAEHGAEVAAAGFEVEAFGPDRFRVRAVPSFRGRRAPPTALAELVTELADGGRPTLPDGLVERRAATIACHAALRAGDPASREEVGAILQSLARLPDRPTTCPHGRPIHVRLARGRLDRWFLRSGA